MYAIVETGGKQYRVKPGDTIAVERLSGEPGEEFELGRVLLVAGNGDSSTRVGSPAVAGAVVRAEVVEHGRGEKIIVFRYKSKVRYRRKTGHRQSLTRLRITDILLDGKSSLPALAESAPPPTSRSVEPAAPAPTENVIEPAAAAEAEAAPAPTRRRRAAAVEEPAEQPVPEAAEEEALPASAGESGPEPEDEALAE